MLISKKGRTLPGVLEGATSQGIIGFLAQKVFDVKILQNPYCTHCGHTVRLLRLVESWRQGKLRLISIFKCPDCGNVFSDPKIEAE